MKIQKKLIINMKVVLKLMKKNFLEKKIYYCGDNVKFIV